MKAKWSGLILFLALFIGSGYIKAAPPVAPPSSPQYSPDAYLPNDIIFGKTYSEWVAAWNRWFIFIPASRNPSLDPDGHDCNQDQNHFAFFLAGIGTGMPVTRSCTIPCGRPLFLPLTTVECSSVEPPQFHGDNPAERLSCAQGNIDGVDLTSLKARLDGKEITSLDRFRAAGQDTRFVMSPNDNVLGVEASTGFTTADGFWLMIKPLSTGHHTLHFESSLPAFMFSQDVTYNLDVKGEFCPK